MISLSCETSTLLGSVAIHRDGQLIAYQEQFRQNSHSDSLNILIDACLKEANLTLKDIDVFGSGLGPGSFTGIRISVNTVKTLSYVHKRPCFGLDSLMNLAYVNKTQVENQTFACGINAFKNMIYLGIYKFQNDQLQTILEPQVVRVQNLQQYITQPMLFIGDAFSAYEKYFETQFPKLLQRNDSLCDYPKSSSIFRSANSQIHEKHWSELQSIYLRASEAEENLNGLKFQPL